VLRFSLGVINKKSTAYASDPSPTEDYNTPIRHFPSNKRGSLGCAPFHRPPSSSVADCLFSPRYSILPSGNASGGPPFRLTQSGDGGQNRHAKKSFLPGPCKSCGNLNIERQVKKSVVGFDDDHQKRDGGEEMGNPKKQPKKRGEWDPKSERVEKNQGHQRGNSRGKKGLWRDRLV